MSKVMGHGIKEILADVPGEYVFYLNDGRILRNMEDLRNALNNMTEELYSYHVNSEKNDFSNWVRNVFRDEKLASDLAIATSKVQAAGYVATRLTYLFVKVT